MLKRKGNQKFVLATASALALFPGVGALAAEPIHVDVNGTPVSFAGAPPIESNGSVLVPLRGVFEAMGASVNYDSAAHAITAKKGSQVVVLPLGSTTASVNGQPSTLSQPARVVDGTTLVPLRFVAEALGGNVQWQAAQNTVAITTPEEHLSQLPAPPGSGTVIGQLTGIYTNTNPQQITVRVNGENTTIPITNDTLIVRSQPGTAGQQVALNDIQIGDQVTVRRDDQGYASNITATYGELRGTVKSVGRLPDGGHVVTLNDGTTVELAPDAILRMNGREIRMSDVMPDEHVLIRTNPDNNYGYALILNPGRRTAESIPDTSGEGVPQAAGPLVTSFDVHAPHPLRAGDVLHATLHGTQGGNAELSIPGVADRVAMQEVSPGIYQADFKVPDGVAVEKGSVLARLTVLGHTSPIIQASQKVTIDAISPRISAVYPERGATVENDQPLIYAKLTDTGGIGIDPKRTRVFIDGQDVTASSTNTGAYVDIRPSVPLAPGEHNVKVSVADEIGNETSREWPFVVSSRHLIDRFETNVQPGSIINNGTDIHFTMQGPANGTASASILGVARDIPLHEVHPGLYRGTYTVKPGDNAAESPIVGRIKTADGREISTILSNGISMAAGTPSAPEITSPSDGADINGNVTVSGIAPPLSTVRVTVGYDTKAAGNLVNLTGTAATREVTADAAGNWSVDSLPLSGNALFSDSRNTQYTITAVTVDPNGQRSPESTITVQNGRVYAHRRGQE